MKSLYLNLYVYESEGADDACYHRLFILRIHNPR